MANWYEIPLVAQAQSFSVQLAGVTYTLQLMYHEANAGVANAPVGADTSAPGVVFDTNVLDSWALDISDSTGNPIVCGMPLIPGIDLLLQYEYVGIGGSLFVMVDGDPDGVPDFAGLGTTGHLYFVTT